MQNGVMPVNEDGVDRRRAVASRGFTLTEIAIVLALIGIMMGGIFVAAASARYHVQLNQGVDEISLIVGNMRSLYASRNASATASQAFAAATPVLVQQGVFPSEMLVPGLPPNGIPAAGTIANNPWDQSTANGSAQIQLVAAAGGNPAEFTVRYINIPADACADLLVHNSQSGSDTGLVKIVVGAVTYTSAANQLPVTPIQAATACPTGATYTIDWYYTLGS